MGKRGRRIRAERRDELLRLQYPNLSKFERNVHFRHNCRKKDQFKNIKKVTTKLINMVTADSVGVERVHSSHRTDVFQELQKLHQVLPAPSVAKVLVATKVGKWLQQSSERECLVGEVGEELVVDENWPPGRPKTPKRPIEPTVGLRRTSPDTRYNLFRLQSRCQNLEEECFALKKKAVEVELRSLSESLLTPELTRKQMRQQARRDKWTAKRQLFSQQKPSRRIVLLKSPTGPPLLPVQPYGGGYGHDLSPAPPSHSPLTASGDGPSTGRSTLVTILEESEEQQMYESEYPLGGCQTPQHSAGDQLYNPECPTTDGPPRWSSPVGTESLLEGAVSIASVTLAEECALLGAGEESRC